jgi:hypothetical protein
LDYHRLTQKWGESGFAGPAPWGLERLYVRRLQTLGALGYLEFNRLAFVQRFVPLRLNRGEMYENIFAGLALNEPESFAGIEPLHCSLFFHFFSLFFLSYLVPLERPQPYCKKGHKFDLAAPSSNLKVLQEQQTQ